MRLIDADAAIKAVEKSMYENPHENTIHRSMHDHEHRHFLTILMGLPSIQPEQRWIPCSERLPNKFEDVWVTDNCGRVAICRMGHTGWRDMESDEWMYHLDSIVAWMPYNAPEPYQEGGKQNGTEK